MTRQGLALCACLMIAALTIIRVIESEPNNALAQDDNLDLIVIEPFRGIQPGGDKRLDDSIPFPLEKPNRDLIVIDPAPEDPAAEDPQSIYLELCRQKAEHLTPEMLQREIQAVRRELTELQAAKKLLDVEKQLQRLIDEHPDSSAAERARLMLESSLRKPLPRNRPRPPNLEDDFDEPALRPIPDRNVPLPTFDVPELPLKP